MADIVVDANTQMAYTVGHSGLYAVDISDRSHPQVIDTYASTDFSNRYLQVAQGTNNQIFVSNRDHGLAMIDVADPSNLREITRINEHGLAGMAATSEVLWVADRYDGVRTYSIIADALIETSHLEGLGHAWDIIVSGNYGWLATNDNGLVPLDLTNPTNPVALSAIPALGGIQDLALSADERTLYAAVGGFGVEIFSLDNPSAPISMGTIESGSSAVGVSSGTEILWAATLQDVVAYDVRDPRNPILINTEETPQWAMSVAAIDDDVVVADWGYVSIYSRISDEPAPDLHPSTTQVFIPDLGGSVDIELHNLGDETLRLGSTSINDTRVNITVNETEIAPGQIGTLRANYAGGGGLISELCLSSSDPDESRINIVLQDGPEDTLTTLGSEAPDFSLETLDGETLRLSDQRGRPVVLVYFATW